MKAVVFSDLHLREDSAALIFGSILPGLLEAACTHDAQAIICLGDVFHLRYRVPVALLNGFHDWLAAVTSQGKQVILLPGNHDQIDVRGRNVLEVFSGPSCQVHSEPAFDGWGLWQPYRQSHEQLAANLSTLPTLGDKVPPVVWFHGGVRGAMMNSRVRDTDGAPTHLFKDCAKVLCGHYHAQQSLAGGRVVYLGSPYQTRADEADQDKGYALWCSETRSLTRVQMAWGRRHVVAHLTTTEAAEQLLARTDAAHSDYRLTVASGVDLSRCGELMRRAGAEAFTLTPQVAAAPCRLQVAEGASLRAYATAYVEAHVPEDERQDHLRTFEALTGERA